MGEDVTPTLISGVSKQFGTTQDKLNVMVLNDQGGAVMNTSEDIAGRMGTGGGNVPMVMENAVCNGNGQTAQTRISDKVGALNCMHDQQAVMQGISGDVAGTLDASYYKGCGERQGVEREVVASSVVRRLTPLECERLQGYPDHWTDIGEWTDSKGKKHKDADSPRYKALGNSIALPFWEWMAKRMAQYLPEGATMASLFSGIGGFELVFARAGVKPIWNSEIESFPEAVTTVHFGDDERGIKGDYERYL